MPSTTRGITYARTCRWLQTLGAIAPDLRRICELTGLFVASDGTWRCVPFSMRVPPTVRGMFLYATFIDEFPQLKRAHPAVLDGMRTTLQQRGIGFRDTSNGTYGLVHPRDAARVAQFAREHGCGRIVVPAAGSALLPKIMWLFTTPVDRAATEYMPSDTKLSDRVWMPVERADARTPALYGPDVLAVVSWPAVPGHDDYASRMFEVMAERGVPYVLLLHERHGLSSMPETAYDTLERYYEPEPTSQFETFFVNDLSDQPAAERALTTRLHGRDAALHTLQTTTLYRLRRNASPAQ